MFTDVQNETSVFLLHFYFFETTLKRKILQFPVPLPGPYLRRPDSQSQTGGPSLKVEVGPTSHLDSGGTRNIRTDLVLLLFLGTEHFGISLRIVRHSWCRFLVVVTCPCLGNTSPTK